MRPGHPRRPRGACCGRWVCASNCSASVQEFLNQPRPNSPGCLVLDVRLPGRSGLEFHDSLIEANVHLPVVFISGHAGRPDVGSRDEGRGGRIPDQARCAIRSCWTPSIWRSRRTAPTATMSAPWPEIRANFDTLTQREREGAGTGAGGPSQQADRRGYRNQLATVKAHRGHVMRKMKTQSLTELVRMGGQAEAGPGESVDPGEGSSPRSALRFRPADRANLQWWRPVEKDGDDRACKAVRAASRFREVGLPSQRIFQRETEPWQMHWR